MDVGLDIRMLTKCFGRHAVAKLDVDCQSYDAILSLAETDLIKTINLDKLFSGIYILRESPVILINCMVYLRANRHGKCAKFRKLLSYVRSKITILDFLCGLMAAGHGSVADLLLRRIYQRKYGERTQAITKVSIRNRDAVHVLVRKLKVIIDSSTVADPLKALRRLAIEYKSQIQCENDSLRRQQLSEKYLGVLGVEIDSNGFSSSAFKYITFQALLSEFKRVTQMTTCPVLFDGLLHIRLASHYSYCGQGDAAKEMVTQAMVTTQTVDACPELTNIWYETLNVFLLEFEEFPSRENMNKVIQTGYTGMQTSSESDFEIYRFWTSSFLIRMVFACLGIGIRGNIIPRFAVRDEDIDLAQILLVGIDEKGLTLRKRMFYCSAMGRLFQLKNDWPKAAHYTFEAKALALRLGFEEMKYIVGPKESN